MYVIFSMIQFLKSTFQLLDHRQDFSIEGNYTLRWNRHLHKSRLPTFVNVGWLETLYSQRKSFGSMGEFFDRIRSITLIMSCQKGLAFTHSYTQCSPRFITLYCTLQWCYHQILDCSDFNHGNLAHTSCQPPIESISWEGLGIPLPVCFLLIVTKQGSNCCKLDFTNAFYGWIPFAPTA